MPSTVIARMDYYSDTRTLRIYFLSGRAYDYLNVSEILYKRMKASFSKGGFFNKYIRDKFSFRKIV
jgi:hypothetical protein